MAKLKASNRDKTERPSAIARQFIETVRQSAKEQGVEYVDLISGDVHKELKWKSRLPLVCDAMKNSMKPGDEFIHTTPSGKSSTITIRYYTQERSERKAAEATDNWAEDIAMTENQASFSDEFSRMADTKICRKRSRIKHAFIVTACCVFSAMLGFVLARLIFGSRKD